QGNFFAAGIYAGYGGSKAEIVLGKAACAFGPDSPRTAPNREAERIVRPPRDIVFFVEDVIQHALKISSGYPFAHPGAVQFFQRVSPNLIIVRAHENTGKTLSKGGRNPFAEVSWFGGSRAFIQVKQP